MNSGKSQDGELSPVGRLIRNIVCELVDRPEEVCIEEVTGTRSSVITIHVAQRDVGKVIGVGGETAEALRQIVYAAGGKLRRRFVLETPE